MAIDWQIDEEDDGGVVLTLYAIAEPGTIFAPGAAAGWKGRPVPVNFPSGPSYLGYVDSAETIDDGRAIRVRVRLPRKEPGRPDIRINGGRTPGNA